ncbi:MAG: hypothetical protein ACFFD5_04115 [Candidatus Thorarchaeota archaeon]
MSKLEQNDKFRSLSTKRNRSIDVFKGLAITLTIFISCTAYFDQSPSWNRGTIGFGLNYVDIIAPLFVFALALNYKISFERRLIKKGYLKTYLHFIRRSLVLIIIGLLITIQIGLDGISLRWGTLQMLGSISLIYLIFLRLKWIIKLIVSISMMLFHQMFLLPHFESTIADPAHGGILGSIAWTSFLILSGVIIENYTNNKKIFILIVGNLLIIFSLIFLPIWGFNRDLITIPFILISVGISSILFYIIFNLFEGFKMKYKIFEKENFLSIMGKNTLLLYIILAFVKYIPYLLFHIDINLIFIFLIGISMVLFNFIIAYVLYREKIYIII